MLSILHSLIRICFRLLHRTHVNSLWPRDSRWRHITQWTLIQLIACYLMTPSHYLNRCWLIFVMSCGIDLRAIPLNLLKMSILDISLKITNSRLIVINNNPSLIHEICKNNWNMHLKTCVTIQIILSNQFSSSQVKWKQITYIVKTFVTCCHVTIQIDEQPYQPPG